VDALCDRRKGKKFGRAIQVLSSKSTPRQALVETQLREAHHYKSKKTPRRGRVKPPLNQTKNVCMIFNKRTPAILEAIEKFNNRSATGNKNLVESHEQTLGSATWN